MFNQICINEEMLPIHTHTHIYIYIYVCVYVCVYLYTYMMRSGLWTLVILNKGQTTIWEEIEIYSQEKVYTIERLLGDKNIGLVNTE